MGEEGEGERKGLVGKRWGGGKWGKGGERKRRGGEEMRGGKGDQLQLLDPPVTVL